VIEVRLTPDAEERYRALDPAQSFIVQAPAGSGKTGLLIQRYLKLLAYVDAPEEIVAITFTRKAAAEMRARVLAALEVEQKPIHAETAYEKLNRELSAVVMQRNQQAGWHIAENPERLRIQTIDSLCASLTRQMPMLSKFGAQPETIEDASDLYLEAARATLAWIEQDHAIAQDVIRLLAHLDNDRGRIESLLAEMLERRDHWLRHLHGRTRDELETSLKNSRQSVVGYISGLLPEGIRNELLDLVRYAAANLKAENKSSDIAICDGLCDLSKADVEHWQGIAELLLTQVGDWRKTLTTAQGFPSGKNKLEKEVAKAWKARLQMLIDSLGTDGVFRQTLHDMRQLPPACYSDKQWEILGAITRLLPLAVAQLKIIFQASGKVDFSEVAQGALIALGDVDFPTDLALALDYRIKHLLIDEFQDTSISQFKLIEKLIAGWEMGDGRSLFAVGDPMQSIYRFREAEVGLFLQARNIGIGQLILQPITLNANFRSQQGVIDWVNKTFAQIMPNDEDIASGAVKYTPSLATHQPIDGVAVNIHPYFEKNYADEACQVVEIILQNQRRNPTDTIAVLVRNRNHLNEIVYRIKEVGLSFRAIEIEPLYRKSVVQDLLALTRALVNPADRLAWFALLRAPWCGLFLKDMNALTKIERKKNDFDVFRKEMTVWEMLCDESHWDALSSDAMQRIRRVREILKPCLENRQRQSLRMAVEVTWYALGGPSCTDPLKAATKGDTANGLDNALIYLDYLEGEEEASNIRDWASFERGLQKLYASPDLIGDHALQIMTIHKAKGLEFDTVIVPGLGRAPRNSDRQLLKWMEQPHKGVLNERYVGISDLFLAPIQETGMDNDSIYTWIERLEKNKEAYEADRLLYVAATRAKKFLYLLGGVALATDVVGKVIPKQPAPGSLLRKLWPAVQSIYNHAAEKYLLSENVLLNQRSKESIAKFICKQNICRLKVDWKLPEAPESVIWQQSYGTKEMQEEIEFSWVSEMARHVGNVVHRWLQQIAEDEMRGWDSARIHKIQNKFRQNLFASGMTGSDQEIRDAVDRIILALTNAINDTRGQWILGTQRLAQNELRITGVVNNESMSWVIDRTFCDSNGIRWIIDYKTSSHEGSDIQGFLDREIVRYRSQLNRYAIFMQQIDPRPIKLGIYFPLICGWCEW
jgi:ATP-dependent helicase/nuclease subunit A